MRAMARNIRKSLVVTCGSLQSNVPPPPPREAIRPPPGRRGAIARAYVRGSPPLVRTHRRFKRAALLCGV